jgi:hypothetical protein
LRAWLRRSFPRPETETGQQWRLSSLEIDAARRHFLPGDRTEPSTPVGSPAAASHAEDDQFSGPVEAFTSAALTTRAEVLASPCPVPAAPGVYGWWFRRLPTTLDTERCLVRDGCALLYTGISPRRPPASGRPGSSQTLRHRIRYHYTGNAEGSTLRKTVGSLLMGELGIELRRVGSGTRMTFGVGEQALSAWLAQNARVSWVVAEAPWLLEHHLITHLDVPLNLDGNTHNRFHRELTATRAAAVASARALPIVANPGVGGG